jgi:uncharacterized membrane protein YphA (DoxX/SURF4 family)
MDLLRLDQWVRSHRDTIVDLIRIYLGVGLFFKGIFQLIHPESVRTLLEGTPLLSLAGLVPILHIAGGLLMATGIFARLGALVQIPVLAIAVSAVNLPRMQEIHTREAVEFSALTLFLLALIAVWGAGPLSIRLPWSARAGGARDGSNDWLPKHADLFLDLTRMYLGLALFLKGFYIMDHEGEFQKLVASGGMPLSLVAIAHYVIPVHFVGGLMLLLGFATRLGAILQIPLLLGAIFYIYLPNFSTIELRQNLEFTTLVLFLLCVFAVNGSGRYSIESMAVRRDEAEQLRIKHARAEAP